MRASGGFNGVRAEAREARTVVGVGGVSVQSVLLSLKSIYSVAFTTLLYASGAYI